MPDSLSSPSTLSARQHVRVSAMMEDHKRVREEKAAALQLMEAL